MKTNLVLEIIKKAFRVKKDQPGSSSVHVAAPIGSEEDKVRKTNLNPEVDNLEALMIRAAIDDPTKDAVAAPAPSTSDAPETDDANDASTDVADTKTVKERTEKGGPGSGPHPGSGAPKTTAEHEAHSARTADAAKKTERTLNRAINAHDDNPTPANAMKRDRAAQAHIAATTAHEAQLKAHLEHLKSKVGKAAELATDPKKAPEGGRRVATIAVRHGDHLLMGKRRDNGKWTVPGGHVDDGEDMLTGAKRELQEETGIGDAEHIEELTDVHKKVDVKGKPLHVQAFQAKFADRPKTSMMYDPDGEVHRWKWVDISDGLPSDISENLHVPAKENILLSALGLSGQPSEEGAEDATVKKDGTGDDSVDASGLNLDLGSGQCRDKDYLGIDLYPYDDETLIHDLTLGIPFEDGAAQNVRLVNALHEMDMKDPKPLLSEIQRVLTPGGQFHYEGPNEISNHPEYLEETHKEKVDKVEGQPGWAKQTFTRLAMPDEATANDAEPRIGIAQYDMLPADALLAMDAIGYYWSDATSSGRGNREAGYPSQGALVDKILGQINKFMGRDPVEKSSESVKKIPIFKINKLKQIVYGVVVSPNEADLQDDVMTPDEIEETAHNYLEKSRVVGASHSKPIAAFPVESYIAPMDFDSDGQYGPQAVKKGAWILGVKIVDPKEWQKVLDGTYQGFSVGGFGLRDKIA